MTGPVVHFNLSPTNAVITACGLNDDVFTELNLSVGDRYTRGEPGRSFWGWPYCEACAAVQPRTWPEE